MNRLLLIITLLMLFVQVPAHCADAGKVWVLAIGVSKYDNQSFNTLPHASDEARKVASAFAKARQDEPTSTTVLCTDSGSEFEPTKAKVLRELDTLSSKAGRDDTVVIYFCGHGIQIGGNYYLLLKDADLGNATVNLTTLELSELRKSLEVMPCSTRLLIMDACRTSELDITKSGDVTSTGPAFSQDYVDAASAWQVQQNRASATFFACREGERAYHGKEGPIFSEVLVSGINGSAEDSEGRITIQSLDDYVRQSIPDVLKKEVGSAVTQRPLLVLKQDVDRPVVLRSAKPTIVGVPTFAGKGVEPEDRQLIADMISNRWNKSGQVRMVDRTTLDGVLKELGLQNSGVTDPETAQKVGQQANAKYILIGSCSQSIDHTIYLTAKLVDVKTAMILPGVSSVQALNPSIGLQAQVEAIADDLINSLLQLTHQDAICRKCGKHFQNEEALSVHQRKCTFPGCTEVFCDVVSRDAHVKEQHPTCAKCNRQFMNPDAYDAHFLKCPQAGCMEVFCDQASLDQHKKVHETPTCLICKKQFASQEELQAHQSGIRKCEVCQESFCEQSLLDEHISNAHPECRSCKVRFKDQAALDAHFRKCSICDAVFCAQDQLDQHIQESHPLCDKCQTRFKSKQEYNAHFLKCKNCGQSFCTKAAFDAHVKEHKDNTCAVCGKMFANRAEADAHRQNVVKCSYCGQIFLACAKAELNQHVVSSHPECKSCKVRFKDQAALNAHFLRCPSPGCKEQFCSKESLNAHIKRAHPAPAPAPAKPAQPVKPAQTAQKPTPAPATRVQISGSISVVTKGSPISPLDAFFADAVVKELRNLGYQIVSSSASCSLDLRTENYGVSTGDVGLNGTKYFPASSVKVIATEATGVQKQISIRCGDGSRISPMQVEGKDDEKLKGDSSVCESIAKCAQSVAKELARQLQTNSAK